MLLDLNLPDSHGAETIRNVLNHAPGVPVVVLSGMEDEELALEALHQGVQDYLVKGAFDGKQLERSLRYAIAVRFTSGETVCDQYIAVVCSPGSRPLKEEVRPG